MLSGFRWYLENVAHGQISREGVHLPNTYPLPHATAHRTTPYRYRYAYNFTVFGYTAPYWSWEQWQHELDLLALHGINLALMTVGQEAVWEDTFRDFGYRDGEIRSWISLPAHQPWEWMSNIHSYGGPETQDTIDRRAQLGQRILARMRELGIESVLRDFPERFRMVSRSVIPARTSSRKAIGVGLRARIGWRRTLSCTLVLRRIFTNIRPRASDSCTRRRSISYTKAAGRATSILPLQREASTARWPRPIRDTRG